MCHAEIGLSPMQKWIFYDISIKKLKNFDRKLIHETKSKLTYFYTILKCSTIPSI